MFTGLITHTANFISLDHAKLILQSNIASVTTGQSIAVNGCCLTLVKQQDQQLHFDLNPETLLKTNFTHLEKGDLLNLETALSLQDLLDGHLVTGHVDCVGTIEAIQDKDSAHDLLISYPEAFSKYVVEKGSIAVDGISLTVNEVFENQCSVCIIPHTWKHTHLHTVTLEKKVHLEFDIMAKYFEKQMRPYLDKLKQ